MGLGGLYLLPVSVVDAEPQVTIAIYPQLAALVTAGRRAGYGAGRHKPQRSFAAFKFTAVTFLAITKDRVARYALTVNARSVIGATKRTDLEFRIGDGW